MKFIPQTDAIAE